MKPHRRLAVFLFLLALTPNILHAQTPTKIFVASFGNDANDGSRGNPKRNFQAAHDAVAAQGQIVALDTAGYGQLNIAKSVSVTVPPGVNGFVTVPVGSTAISISAGANDSVSLRGLIIEGGGSRNSSAFTDGYGIVTTGIGSLTIEDCTIRNFYAGLFFFPSNTGGPHAQLHNVSFRNCRRGLDVECTTADIPFVLVAGCRLEDNGDGIFSGGNSGGGGTHLTVKDSFLENNTAAIHVVDGAYIVVSNCTATTNGIVVSRATAGSAVVSNGNNVLLFSNGGFTGNQQFF